MAAKATGLLIIALCTYSNCPYAHGTSLTSTVEDATSLKNHYFPGHLMCKFYNATQYDCSDRGLTAIPIMPADKQITKLDLSNNQLQQVQSKQFMTLTDLRVLSMRNNNLGCLISSTFHGLQSLKKLDLSKNKLTQIEQGTFGGLFNLEVLNLTANYLNHTLTDQFSKLMMLKTLDLSRNSLKTLPSTAFNGLAQLVTLDLSCNILETIPDDTFKDLSSLLHLNLQGNQLHLIPSAALAPLQSLQTLDLTKNLIDPLQLDHTFEKLTQLTELSIESKYEFMLSNDTFQYLKNCMLHKLTFLSSTNVDLEMGIFAPLRKVTHLELPVPKSLAVLDANKQIESLVFYITHNTDFTPGFSETSFTDLKHLNESLRELKIKNKNPTSKHYQLKRKITGPAFSWFLRLKKLSLVAFKFG